VTGATVGEVIANAGAWSVAPVCAMEAYDVARGQGIALDFEDASEYVRRFGSAIAGARPSMFLDVLAVGPAEVDVINGAIPPLATRFGLSAPCQRR